MSRLQIYELDSLVGIIGMHDTIFSFSPTPKGLGLDEKPRGRIFGVCHVAFLWESGRRTDRHIRSRISPAGPIGWRPKYGGGCRQLRRTPFPPLE
jgi:hypothetical protein